MTIASHQLPTAGYIADFQGALREKWREIPATRSGRMFSSELLALSDADLLAYWESCRGETSTPEVRGWYQTLYQDRLAGKYVADIGPGLGIDGIYFAEHGAHVTFVDIVEDNLALLRRVAELKNISADYYFIDDFFSFRFAREYDVFLAVGSLLNAPLDFMQRQMAAMTRFLKLHGTALVLAYPKCRYDQSGARDCAEFGKLTDGERTPWCEWYDDAKIQALFGPAFKLEWSRDFGANRSEFNWFELTKVAED